MNRRNFLRAFLPAVATTVVAGPAVLEEFARLTHKRRFFPGWIGPRWKEVKWCASDAGIFVPTKAQIQAIADDVDRHILAFHRELPHFNNGLVQRQMRDYDVPLRLAVKPHVIRFRGVG